ncbi:MAG: hypothetical protein WAV54_15715 [Acidimicrobiales bacterium]|jgi:hypothetical protein
MATTVLLSDRYEEDPEWQSGYQVERHDRWLLACAGGGLIGLLIGRSHHPVVWASLLALVVADAVAAFYLLRREWFPSNPRSTASWPGIGPR